MSLSCSKENAEPRFVPGNVIVGFRKDVSLRQALEFVALNADSIGTVSGFYYYSNLPNDSVGFIQNTLDMEGVEHASVFVHALENRIVVVKNYYQFDDKSTLQKWLAITEDPILQRKPPVKYIFSGGCGKDSFEEKKTILWKQPTTRSSN